MLLDSEALEKEERVSVWLGQISAREKFHEYLQQAPDFDEATLGEPGEHALNAFAAAYSINWYDEDLQYAAHTGAGEKDVAEVLDRVPYAGSFIEQAVFAAKKAGVDKATCCVLLYEFDYSAADLPAESIDPSVPFQFIGTFKYDRMQFA